jgi:hypothetical protein
VRVKILVSESEGDFATSNAALLILRRREMANRA